MKFPIFLLVVFVTTISLTDAQRIADAIHFYFYFSGGVQIYSVNSLYTVLENANFKDDAQTVFYFYGLTQNINSSEVVDMRNAYVSNGDNNFILFDLPFDYAIQNEDLIGALVAVSIIQLIDSGIKIANIDLVGFSFGAQCAGAAARYIQFFSMENFILPRVIGLEPSILCDPNLTSGDAKQVVTIHTGNVYSDQTCKGDVSFWINGGVQQPMCSSVLGHNPFCSHTQVQQFWREAVISKSATAFAARKCASFSQFLAKNCYGSEPIGYMNPKASILLKGNYYLNTNKHSPFAKPTADP